ncbi:hypothetical protein ACSFA2_00630 [Variovorax sp. LT2P21]|uniref:hypothetical protein n=1 Tax=Variovorax sp. LT2P21 TaxID=3443731 RepID=UPI003F4455A9
MYLVLVTANWRTTGEIKRILPPEILLRVFAVFMVAGVIFALAVLKIIQESTVSALLGAVATGVLGFSSRRDKDSDGKKQKKSDASEAP